MFDDPFEKARFIKIEKNKARALRMTAWWQQKISKGLCFYCNEKFKIDELSMDHRVPLARGGKSTKKNVVVSCKLCNFKKGHQTLSQFESLNK